MTSPPSAATVDHFTTLHGKTRNDQYHWLRDDNWQVVMREPDTLKPEIREHLLLENAHTERALSPVKELRDTLFEELKGRIKENESSVPARDGVWDYYVRYIVGSQHPRYCRRPARKDTAAAPADDASDEQVLLDADAASKAHAYFKVGGVTHSRDHRLLCHGVDTNGSEYYTLGFKDLSTDQTLPDHISNTSGSACFSADSQTVFYVAVDDNHRPSKVFRHRLGSDTSADALVYEEPDPGFFVDIGMTEDNRHIVISCHDHTTTEMRLIDANAPDAPPRLVAPRKVGLEYSLSSLGDELLFLTNADAEDFKLAVAPTSDPGLENWRDLVGHRPGCLIVGATTFARHIVRLEREGGLPRIVIRRRSDGEEHSISFDEHAYSLGLGGSYEFDTDVVRFTYSSPTTPEQTYDYNMVSRTRTLLKQREVPSGHDPSNYRSARLHATGHDGVQIPITLLWHAQTPLDGTAPVLLYGYGSYGMSMPASFSSNSLSLVNRGFVYAIAHVRGGKDKGYAWYTEGKLLKKKNTFADFVSCAEHLCEAGITRAGEITIHGASAGGMLVGAALNMRPDLFRAAVGQVPFVDVLNTMCDAELPLTPPEWPEWGNPRQSEEAYDYIASYSPYDNIEAKDYPHVLAVAGLTDPRVTYWEPAKWVARLREQRTNDNLLLLQTYMDAGHGGAAGRFEKLKEVALVQAFVMLAHNRIGTRVLPAI